MSRRTLAVPLVLLLAGCASVPTAPPLSREDAFSSAERYREGLNALRENRLADAKKDLAAIQARNPLDDVALYYLALASALRNEPEEAFSWLEKLERSGSCLLPVARSFGKVGEDPRFEKLVRRMARRQPPLSRARVAFSLPDAGLVPEGIAWDPVEKVFYVGSLRQKKVVKVRPGPDGQPARIEDLSSPADELDSVLGLRVDVERRRLWVASSAQPFQVGYQLAWDGRGSLFVYDLTTGKLLKRIWPATKRPHFLNDVVIGSDGAAYATDTVSGEVFRATLEGAEAQPLVRWGTFESPNGLALSEDGKRLYVADGLRGVHLLDLETRKVHALAQPAGLWPANLDGLYLHRGSLIGILNNLSGGRIVRLRLSPTGDAIDGTEVLECRNPRWIQPTTGALVGDTLYYIGSSQFGTFDDKAGVFRDDRLKDPEVLALDLAPPVP